MAFWLPVKCRLLRFARWYETEESIENEDESWPNNEPTGAQEDEDTGPEGICLIRVFIVLCFGVWFYLVIFSFTLYIKNRTESS